MVIKNVQENLKGTRSDLGFVNVTNDKEQSKYPSVCAKIKEWELKNNFQAVIWTEFPEVPEIFGHEKELLTEIGNGFQNYLQNFSFCCIECME